MENKNKLMCYEKYGDEDKPIIVFLHGAFFVHTFGRQYLLSDRYQIIVPHIMGYGNNTESVFEAEKAVAQIIELIRSFNQKVTLVGFSLGAQLACKIVAEYSSLLNGAIIVSPLILKDENVLQLCQRQTLKQLKTMKNKNLCKIIGLMNGLPAKQRKEFVGQMQNVQEETIINSVDNKICFETIKGFANTEIPMLAIAGEKEGEEVKRSVTLLGQCNKNCRVEIWKKAKHNIPPCNSYYTDQEE